ncbi:MAG: hypothetical protein IJ521_06635, partial [Schwartzia sp.]|nr:hypothetical protein [Schwartzia sp. (in: firmicutes)]
YRAERQKPDMPDALVRQEMLADAFADYTTGRRAIAEMAEKQPNTLRRSLNFLSRAMENLKSRFFGAGKTVAEVKYPSARISREQFADLGRGLEYMREELRRQQHLTKGQEMLISMLAEAPKTETVHSPFAYAPDRQFAFDCKAANAMGEMFPKREAAETVAAYSPCGGEGYEARLMASARGRVAGR